MSSEGLHVPRERLSQQTLHLHYAITSLIEELEAVDWYRQRADDTDDAEFAAQLSEYLFSEGSITGREEDASGEHGL